MKPLSFAEFVHTAETIGRLLQKAKEELGADPDDGTTRTPQEANALAVALHRAMRSMSEHDLNRAVALVNGAGALWASWNEPSALAAAAIRVDLENAAREPGELL